MSVGRNNRGRQPKSRPGKPVGDPRAEGIPRILAVSGFSCVKYCFLIL
jgi:hypothetical protein